MRSLTRSPFAVLVCAALSASVGCNRFPASVGKDGKADKAELTEEDDEREDVRIPDSPTVAQARTILALTAEVEELRDQLQNGKRPTRTGIINAHEHMSTAVDVERYLVAARAAGVTSTVMVSSPELTLRGRGGKGEPSLSRNFADVLEASKVYPGEIVPFFAADPHDSDLLARAKQHVAEGGKGVKMYSGHSNFHDMPLDDPSLDPFYAYLEETQLLMLWHINLLKYADEANRAFEKHPKLNVMIPHYGVYFWKPQKGIPALTELMRKYPNIYTDASLGTRAILIDGMAVMEKDRKLFQDFYKEFQDRIMWGTDGVATANAEKSTAWFARVIDTTKDQLEKDVFTTELGAVFSKYWKKNRDPDGRYQGLALPPEILDKVYTANPKRWLRLP